MRPNFWAGLDLAQRVKSSQLDALTKYCCDKIYQEKVSGVSKFRPEFERLKEVLRKGDE